MIVFALVECLQVVQGAELCPNPWYAGVRCRRMYVAVAEQMLTQ